MWICGRCQGANKDGYSQCVHCSAPRNARRFGAGTPVSAPSIQGTGTASSLNQTEQYGQDLKPGDGYPPQGEQQVYYGQDARSPRQYADGAPSRGRQVQQAPPPQPSGKSSGRLVRFVGIMLAVLLPLTALFLAVNHRNTLQPEAARIFAVSGQEGSRADAMRGFGQALDAEAAALLSAGAEAQNAQAADSVLSWAVYGFVVLLAVLFCAAPGLGLWALGHIARGIRRRQQY